MDIILKVQHNFTFLINHKLLCMIRLLIFIIDEFV